MRNSREKQVANLTIEVWRASGERTRERLRSLFDHYAYSYDLGGEARAESWEHAVHYAWELRGAATP